MRKAPKTRLGNTAAQEAHKGRTYGEPQKGEGRRKVRRRMRRVSRETLRKMEV